MPNVNIEQVAPGTEGVYTPYGQSRDFISFKGSISGNGERNIAGIICGPADCGKTLASCWKMHLFCLKYPGASVLMCRKSATALRNSAVITYQKVLKWSGCNNLVKMLGKSEPTEFLYPYAKTKDNITGKVYEGVSSIKIGNLDKSSNHLGAEYDMIYVNQPEEITLEDFEFLMSRCSGRKGGTPYSVLIGDPNPAHAKHWIKEGYDNGRWPIFTATHKDNPELWDMEKDDWSTSDRAQTRISVLKSFSGTRRQRLLMGEWVNNEGLVFGDVWDPFTHIKTKEDLAFLDPYWNKYVGVDFGMTAPFVASYFVEDPYTKALYRTKLIYRTGHTINENAELLRKMLVDDVNVKMIVTDRDPNQSRILEEALGRSTITAKKGAGSADSSINLLANRLKSEKVFFLNAREALFHEPDETLISRNKPIGFDEEVENYRRDPKKPEGVVKEDDHECFTAETEVLTLEGWKSLKLVEESDEVLAVNEIGAGFFEKPKEIIKKKYSGKAYHLSNYRVEFTATESHQHGYVRQMDWSKNGIYKITKASYEELPLDIRWPITLTSFAEGAGFFEQGVDEAWFAGFWVAEGCFKKSRPTFLVISQTKEPDILKLRQNLDKLGWTYSESKYKDGAIQFNISGQKDRAIQYKENFGEYAEFKKISPQIVNKMSKSEREAFWDGYMCGDGNRTTTSWHFDSISEQLTDDLQFLTLSLGYGCRKVSYDCMAEGRLLTNPAGKIYPCKQVYRGSILKTRKIASVRKKEIKELDFLDEMVYCITTSTGFFLARTNGKVFVAGNCDAVKYLITELDAGVREAKVLWI